MDYKTNIINQQIEATDNLLEEINGLHFVVLGEDKALFDYTAYFIENNLEPIHYKVFMRLNKHFIESFIKVRKLDSTQLFYQNKDGHILVTGELVFLFLAFANPELLNYFNNLLTEAISDGFALSNGLIYGEAAERLPTDVLQAIINRRQTEETETTDGDD